MAETEPDTGADDQPNAATGADGQETAAGADAPPDLSWSDDPTNVDDKPEVAPEPEEPEPTNRLRLIGVGLIASVVVGFAPLRDAVQGNGSFENAMLRFVLCFGACVLAASVIGRLLDGAPPPEPEEEAVQENTRQENSGSSTADPATGGTSSAAAAGPADRPADSDAGLTEDTTAEDPVTT